MKNPRFRLKDILISIQKIEQYARQGKEVFDKNELIQVWMLYHLERIGEAASQLGRDFHQAHPEVPWPQIIAMRNILIHKYFGIDLDAVWNTIERDLPILKQKIHKILTALNHNHRA